ncbi:MAG: bifunctional oligoribonuclease/PAP phosphatase NrnA [Bacteroidota bacterium]|nr:bifunctional oligoribonuclease/PAP phosphatase NrnA [Bacteroidota bacterium]
MNIKQTEKTLKQIRNIIANAKHVGIITHKNPDGDALGSSMAMYMSLKKQNIKVDVFTPNQYPDFLSWIKDEQEIIVADKDKPATLKRLETCDVLLLQDFNALNRIDWLAEPVKNHEATKILIDHHPHPENHFDYSISETEMSSTAELVYHLFQTWEWDHLIDQDIAEAFYCGILTDTGCFNYNSSDPKIFEVVANLLKKGVRKDNVYAQIYNNYSFDRMQLLGLALNKRMHYFPEHKTAYIALSKADMKTFNYKSGDTEGFVNYPLSIKGTVFTVLFIEKANEIKLSFRSIGDFPANEFAAKYFNGGGHKNAAGGNSQLTLQESIDKFVSVLPDFLNTLKL